MGNAWNPNMVIKDKTGPSQFNRSAVKQSIDAQSARKGASVFVAPGSKNLFIASSQNSGNKSAMKTASSGLCQ